MGEIIAFMAAPFVATIAIAVIHVYLGIHILKREVIFVDLALAQIAALGTTVGFFIGLNPEGASSYLFSLGFVVLGAALFSVTRVRNQRIPQEAIIGITYVVATAAAILVADRAAGGAEHIKEILTGAVLWVQWPTIFQILVVYAIVGGIHFAVRRHFIDLTERYRTGDLRTIDRLWDFLFYLTFGFVIVLSVRIAGILLVFSFLVVPSSVALLFGDSWRMRMIIGWSVAVVVTILGLFLSYVINAPCGPTVVVLLGLSLGVMAIGKALVVARG